MRLISIKVGPFKSINEPQTVKIDEAITVLVGMNESGKTIFLQALQKSNDALGLAQFDPVEDYPRKDLSRYLKKHTKKPGIATALTYQLTDKEIGDLNKEFHTQVASGFQFSVSYSYDNNSHIEINVDERPVLNSLLAQTQLSSDAMAAVKDLNLLRAFPDALKKITLTEPDKTFLTGVETRIAKATWESVVEFEVWEWLKSRIPKFLYFSDYELMPSKMNLPDLAQRVEQAKADPKRLDSEHRAMLALLRMADISITDFTKTGG